MAKIRRVAALPPLAGAVGATAWMLGVPVLAFVLLSALARPTPIEAGAVTIGASGAAAMTATLYRRTRSNSSSTTISDMLLWSWMRRVHAYRTIEESEELLDDAPGGGADAGLLGSLAGALEILDPYTHGHSRRVESLVKRTAEALDEGLSERQIDLLCRAAGLHDIGKMHIPDGILSKNGPLTEEERALMQEHAVVGAKLVAKVGEPEITEAVRHHHEAWDGSGYPVGLSGESIPLFARIIAVADAYDAMVSARPYRASLGRSAAIRTLHEEAGRQFDPRIVESFIEILPAVVRVPVLLPVFGLFQKVARDSLAWARNNGAISIASSTGSAAAAAVLSTALLVSPAGITTPTGGARPEKGTTIDTVRLEDDGAAVTQDEEKDARGANEKRGPRPRVSAQAIAAANETTGEGPAVAPAAPTVPRDRIHPQPPDEKAPPGDGEDPPGGDPEPDPPGGDPEPDPPGGDPGPGDPEEPDDSGDDGGGGKPDGDPQPDKGKDCEVPPPSPGNDKHCN